MIFDNTPCRLGEGPLWHPDRKALLWFDILSQRMYLKPLNGARYHWEFAEPVSAAGLVDRDHVVVASASALLLFDLRDGTTRPLVPLEADNPRTRSNDGRADPQGGFWISTMSLDSAPGAGTIWRFHNGEMRPLFTGLTTPNAICFSPAGDSACFADTTVGVIHRVGLDADGWPVGEPRDFIDLRPQGLKPDGAVIDARGGLWSAQWGAGRVARYDGDGRLDRVLELPASQISCPAFGGPRLDTLFATSARVGLDTPGPDDGCTFALAPEATGQPEHRVNVG
jgi:sugar lactone lactonase YvrE